tara:strand:+ start:107 stop:622 length:516 start_codon:yes stop_codon:yes gene_type:complete
MMRITQDFNITVEKHPFFESINKKIVEDFKGFPFTRDITNSDGGKTNVKAPQTYNNITSPSIILIKQWIINLVRSYRGSTFQVSACWGAKYGKGDYTISHHHYPATFAFVYFLKSPRGSSPLVFTYSGKRIKAEDGKVVIFPGNIFHHVPKNNCEGRLVLAGNLLQFTNDK